LSVNVYIPTPFRHLVGNRASVEAHSGTVRDVLGDIDSQFPGFRAQVVDGSGELARHINIYVNKVEIENLQGESTPVADGDELAVIPALAGGAPTVLTPEMVDRYSRHIIMPQVGSAGQRKIIESKVLVIGAGALGSPIAIYLTLAGVGTIGLVDFDIVDRSNLQRQLLHTTPDIGKSKLQSAEETLNAYNPIVTVVKHETPIDS
jgi:adenylyltransferase/sulfurtransferase